MIKIIVLLALSIVTARFLEKRYRVASIAHAVLFVFTMAMFLFTSGISFIDNAMINIVGEESFITFSEALKAPSGVMDFSLSGVMALEFIMFIFMPLLSIVAIVKEIKEQIKELKLNNTYFINNDNNLPVANNEAGNIYIPSNKGGYLRFCKLLN